jgi:Subtilase family
MDPQPDLDLVVFLTKIDGRIKDVYLPPRVDSRRAELDWVLKRGVDRINPISGQLENIALSIEHHDDPATGFVYARQRVVIHTGPKNIDPRQRFPKIFTDLVEVDGDTVVYTTANPEIDALAVVADVNEVFGEIASVDHVLWTAQAGGIKCREGDDPEPADRPDGPHRTDLDRGAGMCIAVIDNGIAPEALTDSWLDGVDVAPADFDALRVYGAPSGDHNVLDLDAGHGTFVTGVVRQVAPGADIVTIKALDSNGVGLDSDVARGIRRAIAAGANIINLSIGGYTTTDTAPPAIVAALAGVPAGTAVVAAAGNESTKRPLFPASIPGVVGVAALDLAGGDRADFAVAQLAAYSNRPSGLTGAGLVATAGCWTSVFVSGVEHPLRDEPQDRFDGYALSSGTSFSAAALSGAIAVHALRTGRTPGDIAGSLNAATTGKADAILHVDVWSA